MIITGRKGDMWGLLSGLFIGVLAFFIVFGVILAVGSLFGDSSDKALSEALGTFYTLTGFVQGGLDEIEGGDSLSFSREALLRLDQSFFIHGVDGSDSSDASLCLRKGKFSELRKSQNVKCVSFGRNVKFAVISNCAAWRKQPLRSFKPVLGMTSRDYAEFVVNHDHSRVQCGGIIHAPIPVSSLTYPERTYPQESIQRRIDRLPFITEKWVLAARVFIDLYKEGDVVYVTATKDSAARSIRNDLITTAVRTRLYEQRRTALLSTFREFEAEIPARLAEARGLVGENQYSRAVTILEGVLDGYHQQDLFKVIPRSPGGSFLYGPVLPLPEYTYYPLGGDSRYLEVLGELSSLFLVLGELERSQTILESRGESLSLPAEELSRLRNRQYPYSTQTEAARTNQLIKFFYRPLSNHWGGGFCAYGQAFMDVLRDETDDYPDTWASIDLIPRFIDIFSSCRDNYGRGPVFFDPAAEDAQISFVFPAAQLALFSQAEAALDQDNFEAALNQLELIGREGGSASGRVLALSESQSFFVDELLVEAHEGRAGQLISSGNFAEAISHYDSAASLEPSVDRFLALARAHVSLGDQVLASDQPTAFGSFREAGQAFLRASTLVVSIDPESSGFTPTDRNIASTTFGGASMTREVALTRILAEFSTFVSSRNLLTVDEGAYNDEFEAVRVKIEADLSRVRDS